jgi:Ulp1 family protease
LDSLHPGGREPDKILFLDDLMEFFGKLYLHNQTPFNVNTLNNRTNLPRQQNGLDCGAFLLEYAARIARTENIDAELDFTQAQIPQIRERVFNEISSQRS